MDAGDNFRNDRTPIIMTNNWLSKMCARIMSLSPIMGSIAELVIEKWVTNRAYPPFDHPHQYDMTAHNFFGDLKMRCRF